MSSAHTCKPSLRRLQLYKVAIHLNEAGSHLVCRTYFAALLRGIPPPGLPTESSGRIDPAVAKLIHETAWKSVREHRESGVN